MLHKLMQLISDVATTMQLTLMILAGVLSRYWDARIFAGKRQAADAKVARGVGLGLLIAAPTLYLLKQFGEMFILK